MIYLIKYKFTVCLVLAFCLCLNSTMGQGFRESVKAGEKFYREGDFEKSLQAFREAAQVKPAEPVVQYNLGNAAYRTKQFDIAMQSYETAIQLSQSPQAKQKAWYNKGVAHSTAKQLDESIVAFKEALKLDPTDAQARENLQKAILEKQKQEKEKQKEQQPDEKEKDKKNNKPEPRQTKLNPQQVEQFLKALRQKEQEVQRRMQEGRRSSSPKPEKDW